MRYIYNTGGILLSNEVYIYIILEEYYYQMRYIYNTGGILLSNEVYI